MACLLVLPDGARHRNCLVVLMGGIKNRRGIAKSEHRPPSLFSFLPGRSAQRRQVTPRPASTALLRVVCNGALAQTSNVLQSTVAAAKHSRGRKKQRAVAAAVGLLRWE